MNTENDAKIIRGTIKTKENRTLWTSFPVLPPNAHTSFNNTLTAGLQ